MKVIELIGPNGAGKTTLYKALLRELGSILGRDEALYQSVRHRVTKNQFFPNRVLARWSLSLSRKTPWAKGLMRTIVRRQAKATGEVDSYAGLIRIALKMAGQNEKAPMSRLNALCRFREAIDERVLLDRAPLSKAALLDESLFHMIYGLSSIERYSVQDIRDYTQSVPQPAAVIHVTADAKTHFGNVFARARSGHVMPGHRHIIHDEEALRRDLSKRREMDQIVLDVLRARNVPCLHYQSQVDEPAAIMSRLAALLE